MACARGLEECRDHNPLVLQATESSDCVVEWGGKRKQNQKPAGICVFIVRAVASQMSSDMSLGAVGVSRYLTRWATEVTDYGNSFVFKSIFPTKNVHIREVNSPSLFFSRWVVSDSLRPRGRQHARLPFLAYLPESESCSLSDSLQPHELYNPWNSPGQNTGVGSLSLLQGMFPIQE